MQRCILRSSPWFTLTAITVFTLAGCGAGKNNLPSTVTVELPDGTTVEVEPGSGIASLADSQWQFFRTAAAGQGLPFLTIVFGADGNLESFEDNTIAAEIFGSSIRFDGSRHDTTQKGLQYAASTYGAETSDGSGFAFEGRMTAFAAGIQAGTAELTAAGTFDPDDADTMIGVFTFSTRVTLISIPEANQDEEFPFIAHRVVEE